MAATYPIPTNRTTADTNSAADVNNIGSAFADILGTEAATGPTRTLPVMVSSSAVLATDEIILGAGADRTVKKSGKTFETTITDSDAKVPTSGAVVDRIASHVLKADTASSAKMIIGTMMIQWGSGNDTTDSSAGANNFYGSSSGQSYYCGDTVTFGTAYKTGTTPIVILSVGNTGGTAGITSRSAQNFTYQLMGSTNSLAIAYTWIAIGEAP
jgi:hypothetical protein